MAVIFHVTVYATRDGVRSPDDPIVWTADMTEGEYNEWVAAVGRSSNAIRRWSARLIGRSNRLVKALLAGACCRKRSIIEKKKRL